MRMMLKAVMDTESGNAAAQNGSLGDSIEQMLQELHPEAAYFVAENGQRSCVVVFDMADSSQVPVIAEPLFTGMNAKVTLVPCMNLEDLKKGLAQVSSRMAAAGA